MKVTEKIKKKIGGIKKDTAIKAEVIPPKRRKAENQYRENLHKKPSKKEAKAAWDFAVELAFEESHGY